MNSLQERVSQLQGKQSQLQSLIDNKQVELKRLTKRQQVLEDTQVLLQKTAQETQDNLKVHLEDIVNIALDTCFPGEYSFCMVFELKRGATVCEMYLEDDNGFTQDPLESNGGGLADIISFALRIAVWSLSKPDNIIVLDEPFKFLSVNLVPLAGQILHDMSKRLGLQFLMVTHDEELVEVADKVFTVTKNRRGVSKVVSYEQK